MEFVQFKARLQHSSQYLVARVETPLLQLKQNANNIEDEEVIHIFQFCDVLPFFINMMVGLTSSYFLRASFKA